MYIRSNHYFGLTKDNHKNRRSFSLGRFLLINYTISSTNWRQLCLSSIRQCDRLVDGMFIGDLYSWCDDLWMGQSMESNAIPTESSKNVFEQKIFSMLSFVQIVTYMPHYLRMLEYASEPADDWGPARKENQYGRYENLNKKPTGLHERSSNVNGHINAAFTAPPDISSRLWMNLFERF